MCLPPAALLTEAKELLGHVYRITTMGYASVGLASLHELVARLGQVPRGRPKR